MRRHVITYVSVLLLSVLAGATNYAVKQTGGGDFTTIQACANAMAAGDTCTVYAGTYNENVSVSAGGVSSYKTLQVNGTDVVNVLSFTLNSHTKLIGLHIQNPRSPASANCVTLPSGTTDVYITSNNFYACGSNSMIHPQSPSRASYVYVQNNIFSYPCSVSTPGSVDVCEPVFEAVGNHWLVEGNDISHTAGGILFEGSYNVFRNNTFHDNYGTDPSGVLPTHECNPILTSTVNTSGTSVTWVSGTGLYPLFPGAWVKISGVKYFVATVAGDGLSITLTTSAGTQTDASLTGGLGANCHINFLLAEPSAATQFNLVEGNTIINNFGADAHGYLAQGDVCAGNCHHLIIRFNVGAHVGGGGVLNDNARQSSVNPGFYHVKSYNNTWVDYNSDPSQQSGGGTNGFQFNSTNAANINDIFYYPVSLFNFNPYADDGSTDATFSFRNNLAWCLGADTGGTCNLHSHIYGKGSFTDDPGNIKADPKFVNYAANDFHLSASSPAIGAGSYLTTVAAGDSGSGTTLLVNDAGFFQDGLGISGAKADQIRVGTSTVVQITSVDYATNTLVLANSITRSPGNPIYLFSDSKGRIVLSGNAPDLGGLPSGLQETTAPPTGLTATVN